MGALPHPRPGLRETLGVGQAGLAAVDRDHVAAASAFLHWLEERGRTLAACTQAELDQWLAGPSARLVRSANFVRWAVARRHGCGLTAPATRWAGPSGPLDQDRRWADARRPLHEEAYPAADRVPAAILAKPLGIHVQAAIQWQKISAGDWAAYAAGVSLRDGPHPVPSRRQTQGQA